MAQVSTWPGFGAYAATKAALGVATETLAMELVDSPVRVLEVIPGPVDTAVQGETRLAPGIERMLDRTPLGDPAVLARLIAEALQRGTTRLIYPRRARLAYALPTLVPVGRPAAGGPRGKGNRRGHPRGPWIPCGENRIEG
jgi:uncharacterized protein